MLQTHSAGRKPSSASDQLGGKRVRTRLSPRPPRLSRDLGWPPLWESPLGRSRAGVWGGALTRHGPQHVWDEDLHQRLVQDVVAGPHPPEHGVALAQRYQLVLGEDGALRLLVAVGDGVTGDTGEPSARGLLSQDKPSEAAGPPGAGKLPAPWSPLRSTPNKGKCHTSRTPSQRKDHTCVRGSEC